MNEQSISTCPPNEMPQTQYLGEVPADDLAVLPEYLLASRVVTDPSTGNQLNTITRIATNRIVSNGNYDNISVLEGNNSSLTVPANQVVAAYIKNEGAQNVVYKADSTHTAQFLIVGTLTDGSLLIQPCGVVNIPGGHPYIVGMQYYTSSTTAGEPTTSSTTGQKLFIPISSTKLLVTL